MLELQQQQQQQTQSSSLHSDYYDSINYHRDRPSERTDRDYLRKERSLSRDRPMHIEHSSLSSSFHRNQRDHSPIIRERDRERDRDRERERERERERDPRDLTHREQRFLFNK